MDDDAFQVGSWCYKVHKESAVNWFTAVNRCRSKNASLAVFSDSVTDYFPSSVLSGQAWIGLLKTRWTWPALSKLKLNSIRPTSPYHMRLTSTLRSIASSVSIFQSFEMSVGLIFVLLD